MKRQRGILVVMLVACAAGIPTPARAQVAVRRQIEAARQQIVNLNGDSAGMLLQSVLDARSRASSAERSWAYALMAIVQLAGQNRNGARTMFEQALRADSRLPVDSVRVLRDLDSEAEVVLQEARLVVQPAIPGAGAQSRDTLRVGFTVASDTMLAGNEGRVAVSPRPNRSARTVVTIAEVGAPAGSILGSSDTLRFGEAGPLTLNLRSAEGRPLFQSGRQYGFTLTALDSFGLRAQARWTMRLDTLPPVMQPLPRSLPESEFRPETLQVRHRSAATLLAGAGLGVVAAVLPTAFGRTELNNGLAGDGTAIVVAGSVTVAGIVGFLNGRRAVYSAENAQYNTERLRVHEDSVRAVRAANDLARQRPPIRLQIVRETNR